VRTNTVVGPGGDAAVLVLKGTPSGLALASDVLARFSGLLDAANDRKVAHFAPRPIARWW